MIEISDLHLRRDGQPILQAINAQIPATGLTAVIGPNGAGKSTLLHCLAGLLTPDQGKALVGGADIATIRPAERALLIALLNQNTPVLPRLTVGDLVAFGRWPHHRGRPTAIDRKIVAQTIATFELQPLIDRHLDTLSGGQRQRAFVAMSHAQTTPWMLLDEPLAALDPKYARDIMRKLHALSRPGPDGRGIVLVLHDLAMAARYADWVVSLKRGQLVTCAPAPEAITGHALSDLFETSIHVEQFGGKRVVVVD